MDCQVVHICDCFPARIRRALAELPETLDETYERALRGINKANWEFAHRMFQFLSVASRPLLVKELAELLAFDFEVGSIPEFCEDWRVEDPVDAVLSTCSTLLAIVDNKGSLFIQFCHFSVKEFLTSTRLAEATDIVSRYHVSMTPAHTLVAQACLGLLLHLDGNITDDGLKYYHLVDYSAKHWVDHALFEEVSGNVEDGMKQLFDPSKPHLAIYVWIYDPSAPLCERLKRNETPLPLPKPSLHYAAYLGLHTVVELLINECSQDVCSRDSTNNATPLHLASQNGHLKAACKLVERGADLTVQDNYGETPLHVAMNHGRVDVALMLIERGADLTAKDEYGKSPLHIASYKGEVDVACMLIERGADLTVKDEIGNTPLHMASYKGEADVARMLIERGADLTAQDKNGNTPLHLALNEGKEDVARMLIERGADLTVTDKNGNTPLDLALESGRVEVGRMIIKHGADLTARDKNTPLHHLASAPPGILLLQKYAGLARMLLQT